MTRDKILLFAQVVGGVLFPVGAASGAAALIEALRVAPGVDADEAQLALLDREYQARIDRRRSSAQADGDSGD